MSSPLSPDTLVVDTHAHVFLPGVLGACGEAGPELINDIHGQAFRAGGYTIRGVKFHPSPMSDLELRLALMDRMGIGHQVLSPYPMVYFYDQPATDAVRFCARHNDEMAALVASAPDRLSGLATLPMQDPQAACAELVRSLDDLGLKGISIGGRYGERELSAPCYDPLWAALTERGLPAFIHPGPMDAGGTRNLTRWDLELVVGFAIDETLAITQLVFGGVLDRHPGLTAVIPHGGGFAPYVRSRFLMALEKRPWGKAALSRPFDDIWRQMVFDCLVHDTATLEYLIRSHGADRIVLGTNFAAWDQDDHVVGQVRGLDLPETQRSAILSANARRLFRL